MLPGYRDPYSSRPLTRGEIGCFLSHYYIWKEVRTSRGLGFLRGGAAGGCSTAPGSGSTGWDCSWFAGVFLNAVFSFPVSAFHLPTALSDFYQNIFMAVRAKHPIACLEQACLGERQEGFEERKVFKKTQNLAIFSPWFCICAEASSVTLLTDHSEGGDTGPGCPERWSMPHPWKHFRPGGMGI